MTNKPPPREWFESKNECKKRLFDSQHKLPLVASEQYGRIYLLNQQGDIVISFTKAIDAYDTLQAELDKVNSLLNVSVLRTKYVGEALTKRLERAESLLKDAAKIMNDHGVWGHDEDINKYFTEVEK